MSLSQVTHKSFPDQLRDAFKTLKTREDVANLLDVSDKGLRHLLYDAAFRTSLYYTFEIPKKSGGIRKITSPIARLKTLQRRLLKVLTAVYTPKNSAHGFVKARSICTNAKIHVRRRHILNIDLEDFFPSINFGRVRGIFLAEPYNCTRDVATVLAQICCYKNELPQGAPTSPIVSNMICGDSPLQLFTLCG
jgi:RNA-directed DNA polymerase